MKRREFLKASAAAVGASWIADLSAASDEDIDYIGGKILGYKPLPAPAAFHRSQAKNRWIFGGNRSGKSESCIGYDLCSYALGLHPFRKTPDKAIIWAAADLWSMVGKLLWQEKIRDYLPAGQIKILSTCAAVRHGAS